MAELAQTSPLVAGVEQDRSYLWRRLHSLTGVLPVGFFMLFHLYENLGALGGAKAYDHGIAKLAGMLPAPYFYMIEIGVLALPILFHGLFGAYIALEGKPNLGSYPWKRNYLYLIQRVSGVIALVYLAYHVFSLRIMITMMKVGGGVEGHPGYINFADMVRHYASGPVMALYVIGTLSCAFHFANGLNGFCWTWGITVGEKSRRVVEWITWALFVALSVPMLHILWTFKNAA